MEKPNKLLTIGQFAALHGINKKTLMWYDEVGLLHPVEVGENGYRYYNYYQSSTLETILQLRDLGVSIPDVQGFLRSRSPAMLGGLIEEKLTDLDEQIRQLERTRADLLAKRAALHRLQHLDLDKIELTQLPEARLIAIPVNKHTPPETAIELMLKQASRQRLPRLCVKLPYGHGIAVNRFGKLSKQHLQIPVVHRQFLPVVLTQKRSFF